MEASLVPPLPPRTPLNVADDVVKLLPENVFSYGPVLDIASKQGEFTEQYDNCPQSWESLRLHLQVILLLIPSKMQRREYANNMPPVFYGDCHFL